MYLYAKDADKILLHKTSCLKIAICNYLFPVLLNFSPSSFLLCFNLAVLHYINPLKQQYVSESVCLFVCAVMKINANDTNDNLLY